MIELSSTLGRTRTLTNRAEICCAIHYTTRAFFQLRISNLQLTEINYELIVNYYCKSEFVNLIII